MCCQIINSGFMNRKCANKRVEESTELRHFFQGQRFSVRLNSALSLAKKDKRVYVWVGPPLPATICVIRTSDTVQRSRAEANPGREELNRICSDVSHFEGRSLNCEGSGGVGGKGGSRGSETWCSTGTKLWSPSRLAKVSFSQCHPPSMFRIEKASSHYHALEVQNIPTMRQSIGTYSLVSLRRSSVKLCLSSDSVY